ncbi:hypothetical protein [Halomonas dongshanensis]|uniref:DUF3742 family protein n=1 Tax=Halomonas dongshanensis TaxID=2890835 RepID=A0ABT2EK58_9GAMM|nr:hypothetical protein [Halomonas dongshanensis]MCS2610954.1 hypothetical protein [Halomonas dongshanensis]
MPNTDWERKNAAWQAASQWRARATQTQATGLAGALKLLLAWVIFGALLIISVVLGVFLLLLGLIMMPFVRYKMKKRMEQMRAERAQDIGGGAAHNRDRYDGTHARSPHDVLEGSYEVKTEEMQQDDNRRK